MLIDPTDLTSYTEFDVVKERPTELLDQDILEAETEVEQIVGHDFTGEEYVPLPPKARLALLKLAQYYALTNSDESLAKGIKSEKIGDYSYTVSETSANSKPDVSGLLKSFIKKEEPVDPGNVRLRIRAL
ncbi:protein YqbG [Domibacillus tundrae]|uniref:protein YqbG n=1 Tax=Domibacillus tundrae TaxID=1587527 RepID=UPI000617E2EA|nr:DUF3199 family protein [Domibacillus tundrae]